MITRRKALAIGAGAVALGAGGYWTVRGGPSYEDAVRSTWTNPTATASEFPDNLVHYATLAANSHNTQPWLFSKIDERVTIRPDLRRTTPVVDPDGHHLFASLGCAAENLMIAASAEGKTAALLFNAEGDGGIEIDLAGNASHDPLFDAILQRQCTRSEYDGKPVSNEDLNALVDAAKVEGCELIMISDKRRIENVLELVIAANTAQVQDPAFAAELKSWLRFSASKAIAEADGLYAACSGNPTMPQWLGNLMFGFVFKPQSENDKYSKQIRSSSGLAAFVTDKNDKQHWVQAGRSYQRFALKAASLGIRNAFINQPVEVATMRPEFSRLLDIDGRRPDLLVRFGYAPEMPKSLRRPVKDVIV